MKIATTLQLKRILQDSTRMEYNRSFDPDELPAFLRKLDPNGFHVLSVWMPHEHIAGAASDLHFRCMVMAKLRGLEAPREFFLDVTPKLLNALHDVPTVETTRVKSV